MGPDPEGCASSLNNPNPGRADTTLVTETRRTVSLTQTELEARLLAAANSLRGPVDPADFKQYLFPLLFLKRLSDNWDAEHAQAEADYAPQPVPKSALADYHRFDMPQGCHWADLRKITENVGYGLQLLLDRLQEANPTTLAGIFGNVAWAEKERLPEHALVNLVDIFNGIPLGPEVVSHDMLGQAYEYLLREFAEASGKKAGEFFTPRAVVRLLTRLLDPKPGESIYDPACGSAGMLIEAVNEVAEVGGDTRTLRLYGQEVNLTTGAIARMNLFMHDIEDFRILRGDTLREPKFKSDEGSLTQFDVVIANPPFSLKNWGAETWTHDPFKRSFCGVPPTNNADLAWVQHMLASMKPETGRVGVVMPHGALFRGGQESHIRQCLLESDLLDAVVGLPSNLFYSTTIPAALLIFRAQKEKAREGHVLFVDGSALFVKDRNQNILRPEDAERILSAYRTTETPDDLPPVRLVPLSEVKENDWDLNIGKYLRSVRAVQATVDFAYTELQEAHAALRLADAALAERMSEAGYE